MLSPSSSRATKRRRSSITEVSFHGINTSRQKTKSVTYVSGTKRHLSRRPDSSRYPRVVRAIPIAATRSEPSAAAKRRCPRSFSTGLALYQILMAAISITTHVCKATHDLGILKTGFLDSAFIDASLADAGNSSDEPSRAEPSRASSTSRP
jgi:hypothetical protein